MPHLTLHYTVFRARPRCTQQTLPHRHPHTQRCVEVNEMDARSYSKRVFDAQSD